LRKAAVTLKRRAAYSHTVDHTPSACYFLKRFGNPNRHSVASRLFAAKYQLQRTSAMMLYRSGFSMHINQLSRRATFIPCYLRDWFFSSTIQAVSLLYRQKQSLACPERDESPSHHDTFHLSCSFARSATLSTTKLRFKIYYFCSD